MVIILGENPESAINDGDVKWWYSWYKNKGMIE
jgi:hypothetical protein